MPETIHCRLCGKAIRGKNFRDIMSKLWSHRKRVHPREHAKSIAKSREARRRRR